MEAIVEFEEELVNGVPHKKSRQIFMQLDFFPENHDSRTPRPGADS